MASQASSLDSPPSPPTASPTGSMQSGNTTPSASQGSPQPNVDSSSPTVLRESRPAGQHPKGKRNRTSPADKAILVKAYSENPQPNQEEIADITSRVSMNKQAVRIWFQNRRQNDRRKARPLSPQLIESIIQGRISLSRFNELPENATFSEMAPPASQDMSPSEQREYSSIRSDFTPGDQREVARERASLSFEGVGTSPMAETPAPASSWAASGQPGSEHFSPASLPPPSSSGTDHDAWGQKPSSQLSQFRLSMSATGQAEITTESPPRPILPQTPLAAVPWPELSRPSDLRRSISSVGSASSSRRVSSLKRSRSSNVQVWENCATSENREDPLIAQAKHESSGSAIAEISLLRSLSSASSSPLDHRINGSASQGKRRDLNVANGTEARSSSSKRRKLERSWSTQARIETSSILRPRQNIQSKSAAPTHSGDKSKPVVAGIDEVSVLAYESDKENVSPDEDGNPRPFRRTFSSVSGRRRLPSGPSTTDKASQNPRRTSVQDVQRRTSLARSATSPSSWSEYPKQYQMTGSRQHGRVSGIYSPKKARSSVLMIYEDVDEGDRLANSDHDVKDSSDSENKGSDTGGRRGFFDSDDVHRFMTGDVSPSKKKEVDAAANLIALKFAR
ncbi:uncharacterized protein C8A04DRAFT_24492 [Dichotomopilus funicola]|uniref:Homeobox domain-containing protein n=1 Tax=Dichotomopilus funicola TaxID=1934379 RepID=A0AAN6VCA8_9PEZI|nr:hypothetical protein C8A04DRAFT_24492 [Dichotomopilus funicola]